ncbi:PilZ domain-containing protein [Rhizobium bangladeshense]|uniref:PilZ domain-containing protein n=1 Tax=Rhizobium bangladeshense TaxID=1138189 RepID=A0ABS7LLN3_9HYPH|nr:PilZ domain-containing protein [Rhizobium bangladeshense]MBX4874968.1 PilZ domain-containing protein [Rhizobium bangladeshense]MBX4884991.1 PilZ domain-containing protein [Rhizobium bangladeshense]MBX4891804.1 PilZ domain-containing protein [Rhizobium bangladeshense]MBX4897326.1 PilZ domain-containing protein [Rhizobium bangladeshense]MBX4902736.1 PilZ domain-containing protein [Rhizobium bangladeshense]
MTMLRATHLATVKSAIYDLRWEEFNVKRPARIVAVRPCLTGVSMRSAEIIDISQGGATFIVSTTAGLPKHYYLNILGLAYRIGCAEVYRHKERVGVRFINLLDPDVLRRVVRADFLVGNMEAIDARRAPIFRETRSASGAV